MTQADPGEETRIVPVGERSIVVRRVTPAQRVLLMRITRNLRRGVGDESEGADIRVMENTAKILDIIESAVVQQTDRDYMEDLIIERKLDLKEMVGFVTVFDREDAEEAKPARVRRGRSPKSTSR